MNAKIHLKEESEITGIGAAVAAGLHVNYWKGLDEVEQKLKVARTHEPTWTDEQRAAKLKRWDQAVQCSFGFGWLD